MSTSASSTGSVLRPFRGQALASWQDWWLTTSAANRLRVQLGVFAVVCLVAFHYSLSSLLGNLELSTPLAYIGLVPAIALAVAALEGRTTVAGPDIHDRQLDWIVGLPLIAASAVIELLLPNRVSAMFWVWRLDLLAFPLFVAGVVALLFGTRMLWRQKFAVGYLLLAWPLPYMLVLLKALNGSTSLTLGALRHLVKLIHVAKPIAGTDGSLFQVTHHGATFPLSVVSACSGVDSVFGFLLVGSALAVVVRGPRLLKALWLAGGIFLLWAINVGRIMFIFWAGRTWGEHFAIGVLHPFIGLLTFSLGVVLMLLVMPLLRLHLAPVATHMSQQPFVGRRTKVPVTNILPAVGILLVVSVALGVNNTALRAYDLVASSTGEARLASYSEFPASPSGWAADFLTSYTWARPYFGEKSTWLRYVYYRSGPPGDLNASLPVTADVVDTTSLSSFSAYGVQACYNFHGYSMRDVANIRLPGGIHAQSLSYTTGSHGSWTIIYWIMPVKTRATGPTHYERVILYLQGSSGAIATASSVPPMHSLQNALNGRNPDDKRLITERAFLAGFAREVILAQTKVAPGTVLTSVGAGEQHPNSSGSSVNHDSSVLGASAGPPPTDTTVVAPSPSVDPDVLHLLRGNVELARRYAAMTPLERIRWRAAAPQLFAGD